MASNNERTLRQEIVVIVKGVQCRPNQNLRDVELPGKAYEMADQFTRSDVGHKHYYAVLDDMERGGVYGLLVEAAGEASFKEAYDMVGKWRDAFKSLFRYALNLLLAPNRPELKTVKLYNSYYVYKISDKLKGSERVLHALGYHPKAPSSQDSITSTSQELEFKGQVDRNRVANIATDLVILQSDLEHLREKITACGSQSSKERYLEDVLKAWKEDHREFMIRSASISDGEGRNDYTRHAVDEHVNSAVGGRTFHSDNDKFSADISRNMDQRIEADGIVRPSQEGMRPPPNTNYQAVGISARSSAGQYKYVAGSTSFNNPRPSSVASRESSLRKEEFFSNSTSADEDSFSMAAENIPRPNIDELPEPVSFSDDGNGSYLNDVDVHMSLGHIINSRSDGFDESLIGHEFYAATPGLSESVIWQEDDGRAAMEIEQESGLPALQPIGEVGGAGSKRPAKDDRQYGSQCKSVQSPPDVMYEDYVVVEAHSESNKGGAETNVEYKRENEADFGREDAPGTLKSEELMKPQVDEARFDAAPCSMIYEQQSSDEDGFTVLDMKCKSNQRKSPIKHVEKLSPVKPIAAEEPLRQTSKLMSDKWTCDFCTYINSNNVMTCDICGVDRK